MPNPLIFGVGIFCVFALFFTSSAQDRTSFSANTPSSTTINVNPLYKPIDPNVYRAVVVTGAEPTVAQIKPVTALKSPRSIFPLDMTITIVMANKVIPKYS